MVEYIPADAMRIYLYIYSLMYVCMYLLYKGHKINKTFMLDFLSAVIRIIIISEHFY